MRSYDLILQDGRRIRIIRIDGPGRVTLQARAFDSPHRPAVGRAQLALPGRGGLVGEASISVQPEYRDSGLDYRLGGLLLLVGRESGLERVALNSPPGDETALALVQRLGADTARREAGRVVHEMPIPRKRSPGRSGSWMLRDLHFRS